MMKERIRTTLLLILFTMTVAEAQTVFSGRVVDAEGKPVARASVMLRGEKGRTVAFAATNSEGRFIVKLSDDKNVRDVSVNHIAFAQVVIGIDKFKDGQTITLRDKPVEIREVTVKPETIRLEGDTLTFRVDGFKQKQDRFIEDVITRLPGVSVTPQGKITYQGKEINKFYVEGMDLMGSKYAQVSRNLTADKVKNIQVYENHQPVKMMRGVTFSEQAAMNLQLKDEAKNVWAGVIDAGVGLTLQGKADWLRDARWVEMIFGRTKQSLSMYKTGNTGKDITLEVRTAGTAESGLLNNLTNRSGERTTFNDTHIVATNWLFKTREDETLRLQLAGLRDRIKAQTYSETLFNDVAGHVLMTEEQSLTARQDQWNAELQYHLNASKVNIENTLAGYADFDRGYGVSLLNGVGIPLDVRPRHRSIRDNLQLGWRVKDRNSVNIGLEADYSFLPGTLLLVDGTEERLDMKVMTFAAKTTYFQRLGNRLTLNYNVGEQSRVEMMDVAYADVSDHDRFSDHRIYVYPSLSYSSKRLNFGVEPRVNLLLRSIGNSNDNRFYIDPSASISYTIISSLAASASYRYSFMAGGNLSSLTHIPYYSSYNYLNQGMGDFTHSTLHSVNGGLNFRNIPSSLFAHVRFNCDFTKCDLYSGNLKGGIYSRRLSGRMQHTQNYGLKASVDKRFMFWMTNVSLSGGQAWNRFSVMLGDEVSPVTNRSTNLSGSINVNPIKFMSAELGSSITMNWQDRMMITSGQTSFRNYSHRVRLFFFSGHWQLSLKTEYAYSNDERQSSNLFGDASVMFRTKKLDAVVSLNNIFGTYEQRRRTITELAEYYSIRYMRPRELLFKMSFNL